MYQIVLCDDDRDFLVEFKNRIENVFRRKNAEFDIKDFSEIKELSEAMDKGLEPELLFLDILVEKENGMDFAHLLRQNNKKMDIIFVTSSVDYAVDGYDVLPLHYLIKPVTEDKLEDAISRFLRKNTPNRICIKTAGKTVSFVLEDILYFEINGHELMVCFLNGQRESLAGALKDVEMQLMPAGFIRIHKNYLVNMSCITKTIRYEITLATGEKLPVGKARYKEIQEAFLDYTARKVMGNVKLPSIEDLS